MITRQRAASEMLFAAAIWGFGFIAAIWTLKTWGPFWSTTLRFLVALLVSLVIAIAIRRGRPHGNLKALFKQSLVPGCLVGATLLLQTWGLAFTTATKSSFITTLYVTLVPIFEWIFFRKRIHWIELGGVVVAVLGVLLMTEISLSQTQWNTGDILTVFCAICAAAQIVWIGRIQSQIQNAFEFNAAQSVWAFLVCVSIAFFKESHVWPKPTLESLAGLFSLAIGSTAIAFALRIRAQRVLSATTASLFFLLEAPFATLFAYFILAERLSQTQILGGTLILVASLVTLFAVPQIAT